MSYITDNPWPLLMLLVGIAVAAFLTGTSKGRTIALVSLILAGGLYFLEQSLISPGEEVEIEVATMLDNFKTQNIDAIAAQIWAPKDKLVGIAQQGLDSVELSDAFVVKNVQVTLESDTAAIAMFRANGIVLDRKHGNMEVRVSSFWKTEWRREGTAWKLAAATRLDPINQTELDFFSGQ